MANYADARAHALADLCAAHLRSPMSAYTDEATGEPVLTFTPPLSTAEQATLADLLTMQRFGVSLTLAEWRSIKADAAALKSYLGVASPTAAQTAAAVKAVVRVLATIIRS